MKFIILWLSPLLLTTVTHPVMGENFAALRADRAAIERVYYNHRLGQKPPFEQALPTATLEKLVKQNLLKETVLKKTYGVDVTPRLLAAEVERINTTTRAPEMLAEIKQALGNNPDRFADSFARPILVDRLLRDKFDNDDVLHASFRRRVEQNRNQLIAAKANGADWKKLGALLTRAHSNEVTEITWQLEVRPAGTNTSTADEMEIKKRFGPNAQILSAPPSGDGDTKFYFADLPDELQNVLRVQLRHPGDISAVIETPGGFLLCVTKERTEAVLSVTMLSLAKRSYEQWLADQAKE